MVIQWHLSDRCNLRCAHCYQSGYAGDGDTLEIWQRRLQQFRDFLASLGNPPARLTLTGGEPLALRGFFDLLDTVAQLRDEMRFAILTNGTLIDAKTARDLAARSPYYVQVSLDGLEPTHDAIRGPGAFGRAVAGIEALVAAGVHTVIAFTAQPGNFREFPEIARLGARLGAARVWSDRVIPEGQSRAACSLSAEDTRHYVDLMADARAAQGARAGTEVSMKRALQFLGGDEPAYRCSAARSLIAVMPNGDVYPCRRLPIAAGNLDRNTLADIYAAPAMQALRHDLQTPPACQDCLYASLCRGGLRCLAYALTSRLDGRDPGCWLQPD